MSTKAEVIKFPTPETEPADTQFIAYAEESKEPTAMLAADLREAFNTRFKTACTSIPSDEKSPYQYLTTLLVREFHRITSEVLPIAWDAETKIYYLYSPRLHAYTPFDSDDLGQILAVTFQVAQREAIEELQKACKTENLNRMPYFADKDLLKLFKTNIRTTLDAGQKICPRQILVMNNCFLNLAQREVSLDPLSEFIFHDHSLRVAYVDVEEPPEIWLRFCGDIGYAAPEMRAALEDLLVYLFSGSIDRQEAFFFIGSGKNGKSVLLKFVELVYGSQFVTAVSLEQIGRQFGLQPLIGKRLSISSESGSSDFIESSAYKAVVTGDRIVVDKKHEAAVSLILRLKFVFALNSSPRISDNSEGMKRRCRVFRFDMVIAASKVEERFEEKLFEKGTEIVSWCFKSHFKRYQKFTPDFPLPKIFEQWKADFFCSGMDPISNFISEVIEITTPDTKVKFPDLYRAFLRYTNVTLGSTSKMREQTFGQKFREMWSSVYGDQKLDTQKYGGMTYYVGVKVRNLFKEAEEKCKSSKD